MDHTEGSFDGSLRPCRTLWMPDLAHDCILRNLLTNAIRYTERGGRILIRCRRKGSEIRIDVYDAGIGIPEQQLPRIFESFTRLAPERSNGSGIGLSIVRRALDLLCHRIEVRSIVGEGSLFSIYTPGAAASGNQGALSQLDSLSVAEESRSLRPIHRCDPRPVPDCARGVVVLIGRVIRHAVRHQRKAPCARRRRRCFHARRVGGSV